MVVDTPIIPSDTRNGKEIQMQPCRTYSVYRDRKRIATGLAPNQVKRTILKDDAQFETSPRYTVICKGRPRKEGYVACGKVRWIQDSN